MILIGVKIKTFLFVIGLSCWKKSENGRGNLYGNVYLNALDGWLCSNLCRWPTALWANQVVYMRKDVIAYGPSDTELVCDTIVNLKEKK